MLAHLQNLVMTFSDITEERQIRQLEGNIPVSYTHLAGKPTDKPNLVCGPVQICWHKFARYWDVELDVYKRQVQPILAGCHRGIILMSAYWTM